MVMTTEASNDFFIYVPTTHDVKTLAHMNADKLGESAHLERVAELRLTDANWIRIAIDGELIVYAHIWDEQE